MDKLGSLRPTSIHSLVVKWLPSKESSRVRFPLDALEYVLHTQVHKTQLRFLSYIINLKMIQRM